MTISTLPSTSHAESLHEQGFCVLENLRSPEACKEIQSYLENGWRSLGSPQRHRVVFHPLLQKIPEMAPFVLDPTLMKVLHEGFGQPAEIRHGGGSISFNEDAPPEIIGWHHHYGWDTANLPTRKRIERVVAITYTDGSSETAGALSVIPRRYNDPIGEKPANDDPRETTVYVSPGSVVIFDTAVWHRARHGSQPGLRRNFGGHYQAKADRRPHREDNDVSVANQLS